MNLVAFWRNEIPEGFKQREGTLSDRIAGQIQVTCGFDPLPEWIQSEQSVVCSGYGAFVVNNVVDQGVTDPLINVLAIGPVLPPSRGVERFEWDTNLHKWASVWARRDVSSTSMVPCYSAPSDSVVVNGYAEEGGWQITGMDWGSGEVVHQTIFGKKTQLGNGACALLEYAKEGDLIFNSAGGPTRVSYRISG